MMAIYSIINELAKAVHADYMLYYTCKMPTVVEVTCIATLLLEM